MTKKDFNKEFKITSKNHVFHVKSSGNVTTLTTFLYDSISGVTELISDDVPLRLTEAKLLLLLLENAGRVISKEEIMAEVWQNKLVTESSIRQVVYNLRGYLHDKSRPHQVLHNFRCVGYTLDNCEKIGSHKNSVNVQFTPTVVNNTSSHKNHRNSLLHNMFQCILSFVKPSQ